MISPVDHPTPIGCRPDVYTGNRRRMCRIEEQSRIWDIATMDETGTVIERPWTCGEDRGLCQWEEEHPTCSLALKHTQTQEHVQTVEVRSYNGRGHQHARDS
ncbi:Hypothetical protein NTJ_04173 [Nesidiocoris tenuis]|uniref:MAM domain-containing protein n=1 Tax=Nesidiocoris tenuis TaxID=355587 RepID=A0ABN7AKG0_9HEMI|nr:Hypothetical protein NTJ_04173 [Nesidiocoris tenuis]